MATTSLEAIRRVTMEAREKGFDEVAAKLDKITKAQEGVVASSTSVEKSSGSTEQAFKRVERQLDSSLVAYQKYASQVKAVNDQLAQNPAMQKRATELIGLAETRLRKATGATENFGEAAGPARHEWINLSRQLQDIGVSLQGGMPLLTVIAQQGSQISDAFISSKASMGQWVSAGVAGAGRFLAAWGPVIAAVGAVGATAFAAMRSLDQEREARVATTSGLGRLSGVSGRQVGGLAESTRTSGMSLGDAREGVLEFIKAGASATTVAEGMALATQVAATRGTELSDAYKLLARAIRDPAAAANQLGDEYRILDADQRKNIATMQASGDRAGAIKAVFDALRGVVASNTDATSLWANAWNAVKDAATGAANALAKTVRAASPEEQLRAMQERRRAMDRAAQEAHAVISPPSSFVAPTAPTVQPAPRPAAPVRPEPTAADLEAFKQEEVIRRSVLEVTKQQDAIEKSVALAKANIAATIKDQNAASQEQIAVMMATTIETRALATETQTYNEAIRKGTNEETARNAAVIAGNLIRAQAIATTTQHIAAMQAEIDMTSKLAAAAAQLGEAGVRARAEAQQELEIRKQQKGALTELQQQEIATAGNKAMANKAVADADANRQVIESQRAQLSLGSRMIAAAKDQSDAGDGLRAGLQEEQRLLAANIDVTSASSKTRIANAAAIAEQQAALQSENANRQAIDAQQAQLSLGPKMLDAAKMQGEEGTRARAALQEEQRLLAAGIETTLASSQTRIANAAAIAQQTAALQSANTVRQQNIQIEMGARMIEAAKVPGAEGDRLRAGLQEEQRIRQEGLSVLDADSQKRMENARTMVDQARAMKEGEAIKDQREQMELNARTIDKLRSISELQGLERFKAIAAMNEENKIIAEGGDITSKNSEERIKNAQAIAVQKKQIEDINNLMQITPGLQNTLEMLELEISLIGQSNAVRQSSIVALQYEQKARAAEADGLLESADAYRRYGAAIADATYRKVQGQEDFDKAQAKAASQAGKKEHPFAAGGDQPLSERGGFTRTRMLTWAEYQDRAQKQDDKAAEVRKQVDEAAKAGQQRQLSIASSTIQDQIQALNDQRTAIGEQTSALDDQTKAMEQNTSALEKETTKRRAQLDKQIAKLEKALTPSRPDPYAERNPDYFYRFGSQAFKENDPTQALLAAAEAERDGLDKQLEQQKEAVEQQKQQVEQQKKAVELQQKAIDQQIKGYETQAKQLDRAGNLLSSGVELSAQEVSGLQAILAAIGRMGDFARLQEANVKTTLEAQQAAAKSGGDPASEFQGTFEGNIEQIRRGKAYQPITPPTYGFQKGTKGFSGFFAAGGYIPPGSWGIAGESGPEVIRRKRAVAGPATVTPIGAGRPIVVNQTFVSQAGAKDLRASRGEIAQRSSSEMRRSLGAR